VSAASVESARQERLAKVRDTPDVRVNLVKFDLEGEEDDASDAMHSAHALCVEVWGPDNLWDDVRTRADSCYEIYEYDTGSGRVGEVADGDRSGMGTLEFASHRSLDPAFKLSDVHRDEANTELSCIREGGYRDRKNYIPSSWPALN
jgi:hypothetical protein